MSGHADLTEGDRRQIAAHGMSEEEILRQIATFRNPPPPARLLRPATSGDGIVRLDPARYPGLLARWEIAAADGRLRKFVPASGASTRMFEDLQGTGEGRERTKKFFEAVGRFPFHDALAAACRARGLALQPAVATGAFDEILSVIFSPPPAGLGYGSLPKALVPFHHGPGGARTPFEEHLDEAIETVRDVRGVCRVHFTVAPECRNAFKAALLSMAPPLEAVSGADLEVTFSSQDPSTDTVAADEENRPFRQEDGSLLFRPGGHGALLPNLEATRGDLVFVKNIDNVQPRSRSAETILWKKLLAGLLVETLETLGDPGRPVRVCGVVRNEGEPGGGPFWVAGADGASSLQIVESSQVDHADPRQEAIWRSSTHFNPVDLVCALREPDGTPYQLARFVDPATVFISKKSKDGRVLKALERPGLWNGAMAGWHTVFVEVPIETFTPVKTVFDLLRPEHQPG
ncbi:MAG TPA: DUF4301 family protein [Thermoanaerobaculia bacterium]|nr:DUF4301 family protein [Thermoanaerobaculia bacterium]